jgi:hypothetical protein
MDLDLAAEAIATLQARGGDGSSREPTLLPYTCASPWREIHHLQLVGEFGDTLPTE